jgi:hypothetical protein
MDEYDTFDPYDGAEEFDCHELLADVVEHEGVVDAGPEG